MWHTIRSKEDAAHPSRIVLPPELQRFVDDDDAKFEKEIEEWNERARAEVARSPPHTRKPEPGAHAR